MLNTNSCKRYDYHQSGFTLIELMISLVLGLIISAAVIQIYIISVKTSSVQASGSELQDASVFGLQQLEKKVRLANLGNSATRIDSTTAKGGIVLTGANLGITSYTNTGYLTRRAGDSATGTDGWTGISNTSVASDQLTIQYTNITGSTLSDCEGSNVEVNDIAIERYFLRPVIGDSSSGAIKNLVLACDAGRIVNAAAASTIAVFSGTDSRNFGKAGQEFIVNTDQFKVLLGVQYDTGVNAGKIIYLPSSAYLSITADRPAITSVKLGLIVHGSTPVLGSTDQTSFILLGQDNVLKTDTTRSKQVRKTYETTTLLRNARVVNVKTSL